MTATAEPQIEIRPQEGPQRAFLSSSADIVVYGGGAGGGKSWALLLEALRHIRNPGFGAVIFRRLSPQITSEGGLWDEAGKIYPLVKGTPRIGDLDYRWEQGGKISFRHLQHEATKYNWQGSQIPLICFDELTHFTESQFFYMLSRNRSMCGVRPYVRATTNPDAGSWVKRFLGPWVDRKHALFPARSGEVLFFIRDKGKIVWYRTREECLAQHPAARPKTATFIRATVFDNKKLLEADPDYLANLEAQGSVERARLLDGDWDVVNEGLVYPEFGTSVVEPNEWPAELKGVQVGGMDWGWRDPFTALLATEDVDGTLWVHYERYAPRKTLTEHSKALPREDNPRWWADPSGATQIAEMRLAGHDVVACVHLGQKPIKAGVSIVTERIRSGTLKVRGDLGNLIDEAAKYRYAEEGKGDSETPLDKDNHLMDALRYLIVGNDRGQVVQDEEPPESAEQLEARAEAERLEKEQAEREHYSVDNDLWWERG